MNKTYLWNENVMCDYQNSKLPMNEVVNCDQCVEGQFECTQTSKITNISLINCDYCPEGL